MNIVVPHEPRKMVGQELHQVVRLLYTLCRACLFAPISLVLRVSQDSVATWLSAATELLWRWVAG